LRHFFNHEQCFEPDWVIASKYLTMCCCLLTSPLNFEPAWPCC
jgi:hypothetical protein